MLSGCWVAVPYSEQERPTPTPPHPPRPQGEVTISETSPYWELSGFAQPPATLGPAVSRNFQHLSDKPPFLSVLETEPLRHDIELFFFFLIFPPGKLLCNQTNVLSKPTILTAYISTLGIKRKEKVSRSTENPMIGVPNTKLMHMPSNHRRARTLSEEPACCPNVYKCARIFLFVFCI